MESRSNTSFRNILVGILVQAIEVVLKFVGRTIFIRSLAIAYLGVNGLFAEILTMFSLAELGIGGAMGYALYKPLHENNKAHIGSLMDFYRKAYMFIGVTVLALGLLFLPFLKITVKKPPEISESIVIIYLVYLFQTVSSYFFSYRFSLLTSDQKTYIIQSTKAAISIIRTIVQAVILLCFHSFYGYLLAEAILIFVNNFILYAYVGRHYPYLNQPSPKLGQTERHSIFVNVKALSIYRITTLLVNSTENILISIFVGLKEVGLYSNYLIFVFFGTTFLASIFSNISPSVGNLNAEGDLRHSKEIFKSIHLMNFWLYGLFSIGLVVCLEPVLTLWLGKDYLLGFTLIVIIAANFYIKGMQNAVWVFKDTFGLFRRGQYMAIAQAAIHLSLASLLGWKWGICGILCAAGLARIFSTVWYDSLMLFKYGFQTSIFPYYTSYIIDGILFVLTGGITYYIASLSPFSTFMDLAYRTAISLLLPNLIFFMVFRKKPEFKTLADRFIFVLRSRLMFSK